jgi:hypothetical protein
MDDLPAARVRKLEASGFEPADLNRRSWIARRPGDAPGRLDAPATWLLNGRPLVDPAQWDVRLIYSMHG